MTNNEPRTIRRIALAIALLHRIAAAIRKGIPAA
jgi:hypothetical protein